MNIQINDTYRIAGNAHCWAIEKREYRKRKGKKVAEWRAFKWFPTFEMSLQHYWEFALRTSEAQNFVEALGENRRIAAEISRALSPDHRLTLLGLPSANDEAPAVPSGAERKRKNNKKKKSSQRD